jgi:hypothetical protein
MRTVYCPAVSCFIGVRPALTGALLEKAQQLGPRMGSSPQNLKLTFHLDHSAGADHGAVLVPVIGDNRGSGVLGGRCRQPSEQAQGLSPGQSHLHPPLSPCVDTHAPRRERSFSECGSRQHAAFRPSTEVVTAGCGAEIMAILGKPGFDAARQAVLSTPIAEQLVPARPRRADAPRACNLMMTGLIFSGHFDTDIAFDYGTLTPACRRADLADMKRLDLKIDLRMAHLSGNRLFPDWKNATAKLRAIDGR